MTLVECARSLVVVLLLGAFAGCMNSDSTDDSAEKPVDGDAGGDVDPGLGGARAGPLASGAAVGPTTAVYDPWGNETHRVVVQRDVPIRQCENGVQAGDTTVDTGDAEKCRATVFESGDLVPVGTAKLHVTIAPEDDVVWPVGLDVTLTTFRGGTYRAHIPAGDPPTLTFELGRAMDARHEWNLPDHDFSGYVLRVDGVATDGSPPDDAMANVTITAERASSWAPMPAPTQDWDDRGAIGWVHNRSIRVAHQAFTLTAEAGAPRTEVRAENLRELPLGTDWVVTILTWDEPTDCPEGHRCVLDAKATIGDETVHSWQSAKGVLDGTHFIASAFVANEGFPHFWSQLPNEPALTSFEAYATSCVYRPTQTENRCSTAVPPEGPHQASFSIDGILSVEAWRGEPDKDDIRERFGLAPR